MNFFSVLVKTLSTFLDLWWNCSLIRMHHRRRSWEINRTPREFCKRFWCKPFLNHEWSSRTWQSQAVVIFNVTIKKSWRKSKKDVFNCLLDIARLEKQVVGLQVFMRAEVGMLIQSEEVRCVDWRSSYEVFWALFYRKRGRHWKLYTTLELKKLVNAWRVSHGVERELSGKWLREIQSMFAVFASCGNNSDFWPL